MEWSSIKIYQAYILGKYFRHPGVLVFAADIHHTANSYSNNLQRHYLMRDSLFNKVTLKNLKKVIVCSILNVPV